MGEEIWEQTNKGQFIGNLRSLEDWQNLVTLSSIVAYFLLRKLKPSGPTPDNEHYAEALEYFGGRDVHEAEVLRLAQYLDEKDKEQQKKSKQERDKILNMVYETLDRYNINEVVKNKIQENYKNMEGGEK